MEAVAAAERNDGSGGGSSGVQPSPPCAALMTSNADLAPASQGAGSSMQAGMEAVAAAAHSDGGGGGSSGVQPPSEMAVHDVLSIAADLLQAEYTTQEALEAMGPQRVQVRWIASTADILDAYWASINDLIAISVTVLVCAAHPKVCTGCATRRNDHQHLHWLGCARLG
jgi:hypothetical protein